MFQRVGSRRCTQHLLFRPRPGANARPFWTVRSPLTTRNPARGELSKALVGLLLATGALGGCIQANSKLRPINAEARSDNTESGHGPADPKYHAEDGEHRSSTPRKENSTGGLEDTLSKVAELTVADLSAKLADLLAQLPPKDHQKEDPPETNHGKDSTEESSKSHDSKPQSELAAKLAEISSHLSNLANLDKLSQQLPSGSDITEKSATELRKLKDRIPSTQEIAEQLEQIAALIPSAEDVRKLPDQIPSGSEIAERATRLWQDAIDKAADGLLEGTLIAQIKVGMTDPKRNPEIEWEAKVRVGAELCKEENERLVQKKQAVADAISKFIGEDVEVEDVPVISIAASGGGCRAMVANLASMQALDKIGLLKGVTYIAGVSGSTWAMAQLYSLGPDFDSVQQRLAKQLSTNYLSLSDLVAALNTPEGERILFGIVQKYFTEKAFSTVDIFGTLLTGRLLVPEAAKVAATRTVSVAAQAGDDPQTGSGKGDTRETLSAHEQIDRGKLSYQRWAVEDQSLPIPIYTAVSHEIGKDTGGSRYQWWEFTPFEAGFRTESGSGSGAWVPVWGFGRVFESGVSREKLPEQSLGLLLGTFGSAFTATVAHIWNEFKDTLPENLRERVLPLLEDVSEIHPISPARFPNIVYKLDNFEHLIEEKTIALMDSGMDNNIPFPPLLRPERNVDVIIALDASMDIGVDPWLIRAEAYARERGFPFPTIPKSEESHAGHRQDHLRETTCTVLSTISQAKSPADLTLIYLPLIRNNEYDPQLDPSKADWCATYNFTFTPKQTDVLSGLACANVEKNQEKIREAIRRAWRAKRRRRLEEEAPQPAWDEF
ncbi:uncharacterized protein SPPG_06072 [Spizellomyces punctatus DAOM BR117]|uniref:Lysophospholipase n=1 Tax=Spizellomyces punctatus (strain DAOM BR117) TaxID=645134 RepID=A0A0L0HBW3_SPIPD|nr:uncharacterized protein SPPG_06072 [Spizellomyces punctatus DAOM BR117]KNC98364.1 hypothetical protein SPPG_06072 [Spizellomyces punctatus DAOM BR117]|eukprot:XP_016606404.1 hypothetical protein SPPG_06072 [Spizellomyces punctatus DAOM BR117]